MKLELLETPTKEVPEALHFERGLPNRIPNKEKGAKPRAGNRVIS
jgi:hypothetical protein